MEPTSLGGGLTSDLREGVLRQAGIEDGIGDLVAVKQRFMISIWTEGK